MQKLLQLVIKRILKKALLKKSNQKIHQSKNINL